MNRTMKDGTSASCWSFTAGLNHVYILQNYIDLNDSLTILYFLKGSKLNYEKCRLQMLKKNITTMTGGLRKKL